MATKKSKSKRAGDSQKTLSIIGLAVVIILALLITYSYSTGADLLPGFSAAGDTSAAPSALCAKPQRSFSFNATTDFTNLISQKPFQQKFKYQRGSGRLGAIVDFNVYNTPNKVLVSRGVEATFKKTLPDNFRLVEKNIVFDYSKTSATTSNDDSYATLGFIQYNALDANDNGVVFILQTTEGTGSKPHTGYIEMYRVVNGNTDFSTGKKLELNSSKIADVSKQKVSIKEFIAERRGNSLLIKATYNDGNSANLTAQIPSSAKLTKLKHKTMGYVGYNPQGTTTSGYITTSTSGLDVYGCK